MEGWIKLHRRFIDWEWYNDIPTKVLFIHILIKTNSVENKWRGMTISRGQFFTSLAHMSEETGLSIKQIRGSLNKLKTTGEIRNEGASNGTMITVCNYDSYQTILKTKGKPQGERGASGGQAEGNNKEGKELKKEKKKEEVCENPTTPILNNPVSQSNNSMLSFAETYKEFISSRSWQEKLCMDYHLEIDFVISDMKGFLDIQDRSDQFPRKLSETKFHYTKRLEKFLKNRTATERVSKRSKELMPEIK